MSSKSDGIKKQIEEIYIRLNKGDITDTKIISALESIEKEMVNLKDTFGAHDKQEMIKYDSYDTHLTTFNNTMLNVGNKLEVILDKIKSLENKSKESEKKQDKKIKKLDKKVNETSSRQQKMIWVGSGAVSLVVIVAYTITWFNQNKSTFETRLQKQEIYNQLDYNRYNELKTKQTLK